jgi:hypothetical protein
MIEMLVGNRFDYLSDNAWRFAVRGILKLTTALISLGLAVANPTLAAEVIPDACSVLPGAEIQAVLGKPPIGMDHAVTFRGGTTSLCQGRLGEVTLTVRISMRSAQDSANEGTIAQMIIAGGGKVETVKTGATVCTTIAPAPAMASQYGYDSMCSIALGEREVAVQAETHRLDALIPAAKLRTLVGLAAKHLTGTQ